MIPGSRGPTLCSAEFYLPGAIAGHVLLVPRYTRHISPPTGGDQAENVVDISDNSQDVVRHDQLATCLFEVGSSARFGAQWQWTRFSWSQDDLAGSSGREPARWIGDLPLCLGSCCPGSPAASIWCDTSTKTRRGSERLRIPRRRH